MHKQVWKFYGRASLVVVSNEGIGNSLSNLADSARMAHSYPRLFKLEEIFPLCLEVLCMPPTFLEEEYVYLSKQYISKFNKFVLSVTWAQE